ncbi:hypothetical protein ACSYAD_05550 [Acaryochloris marina NIES-2412]|uniref:hypothetical protein n=1 Tax=Acaryochloris marina TaxID=155978 RepID=UPI004059B8CD
MTIISANYFFNKTRPFFLSLPWVGLVLQIAITPEFSNANYSFIAAAISTIFILYLYQPYQWYQFPLSSLTLFGYCILYALGPLLFTVVEKRPINYDLEGTENLFLQIVLCSGVLIFSHFLYTQSYLFQLVREKISKYLDRNLDIFRELDIFDIALIGFIGLLSMIFVYWFNRGQNTVFIKFIQGFIPFAFISIVSLLKPLCKKNNKINKIDWGINILFLILILVSALGRNSRGAFATPIATYGIGVILLWLYQCIKIRIKIVVSIIIVVLFVVPLASNLATSMVMVRSLRGDIPPEELIIKTVDQLSDAEGIEQYRQKNNADGLSGYDEKYLSNPFLRRFVNLKFADISLELERQLDQPSRIEFREFSINRLFSIFPSPLLSFLGLPIEFKQQALSVSWGDQLFFIITRNKYFLGRFWVGHFFGTSQAAFGSYYLFFLGIVSIVIFMLLDSLVIPDASCSQNPVISPIAIINLYSFFVLFNAGSIVDFPTFIFREWIQFILLYFILYRISLVMGRIFNLSRKPA